MKNELTWVGAGQLGSLDPEHSEVRRRRCSESAPGPRRVGRERRRPRIGIRRALRGERPEVDLGLCCRAAQRAEVRGDYVVVGDRQNRETCIVESPDDLLHGMAAVALQRVHVQIGLVMGERLPIDLLVGIPYLDPSH